MFHGTFHFVRVLYEVAAHGRFPSPEAHWVFALVIILNTTRDLTGLILALQNRKGKSKTAATPGHTTDAMPSALQLLHFCPSIGHY